MLDDRPEPITASQDPNRKLYDEFEPIGPGALARRYLTSFWQPVARSKDLKAGAARPLRVFAQDFTIYRGQTGNAQVLAARCPHRGTRLSTGWVEGDSVRCFYHGWKFAPSGQCVEQPAEDANFKNEVCVRSYPTREYLGLVFVYFGEGEAPPLPRLKIFEDERYYLHVKATPRECSYFSQLENGVDEVHINFVHAISSFADVGFTKEIPEVVTRETDYGIERAARRGDQLRIGHCLLPNVLFTSVVDPLAKWMQHIAWRTPIEDEKSTSFIVDRVELSGDALKRFIENDERESEKLAGLPSPDSVGRAILRGEMSLDDVRERPDLITIQDVVALAGQEGMSRHRDMLGRSDRSVALLRRIYAREFRLLSDGKPIKRWAWPEDICVRTQTVA
jgi:5,5'-dehydrodivanillate O-demethylase